MKVALVCYEDPSSWILGKLAFRLRDQLVACQQLHPFERDGELDSRELRQQLGCGSSGHVRHERQPDPPAPGQRQPLRRSL